jgi:hypothetical protein
MEDELRSEYDLKSLQVRKLGAGRKGFGGTVVRLERSQFKITHHRDSKNTFYVEEVKFWFTP